MASGIFTQRQVQREIIRGSWANLKTPAVEYLVVAGGGSGGGGAAYSGGGGGAGGLLQGILPVTIGTSLTVNIGGGGTGSVVHGTNGGDSAFGLITATGGGGGTYGYTTSGFDGGSGGGGGSTYTPTVSNIRSNGIAGQGNGGGSNQFSGSGAGGGAGAAGESSVNTSNGCAGGIGLASSISGTVTTYAGGGASASSYASGEFSPPGGEGGGGRGAYYDGATATVATSGTTNTGGGGGGGCNGTGCTTAGNGGSGIVIVSYPDVYANAVSQTNGTYSTSGSGSFAPANTSSWINYNAQSNLQFGTGDFTIELWVYFTSTSGTNYLIDFRGTNNPTGASFGFYQNSGGLQLFNNATTINYGMPSANTWYNVVWSRTSGVTYFFVNGTLVNAGGTSDTTSYTVGTNAPTFGGSSYNFNSNGNTFGLQGYMSNVRVLKGTGLYTSNFTPSTKPLTAITNTSLLLNTVSGAYLADGSTNANAATVQGAVSWNQASPFATGLGYKNRVYTWTASGTITF